MPPEASPFTPVSPMLFPYKTQVTGNLPPATQASRRPGQGGQGCPRPTSSSRMLGLGYASDTTVRSHFLVSQMRGTIVRSIRGIRNEQMQTECAKRHVLCMHEWMAPVPQELCKLASH